jgi:hypothetical protein
VSGRVSIHPEPVFANGLGHPGGAQRENFPLGGVDVVDLDVEMELLRATRGNCGGSCSGES